MLKSISLDSEPSKDWGSGNDGLDAVMGLRQGLAGEATVPQGDGE
jgi:hypothetical protein